MLFLAAVITASGFGRESDTILVIWRRHVPYVVVFVFLDRHLGFLSNVDVTRYIPEVAPLKSLTPKKLGYSRWNFVAMCSRTRYAWDKIPPALPANVAKKLLPGQELSSRRQLTQLIIY